MGTTLAALQRLQAVETQLAEIRNRITALGRRVELQEMKLRQIDDALANEQRELQSRQMEADRLELDVKSYESEISKLRTALNSAKTNKEYAAILTQLNTVKVDSSKVEERALEMIARVDELKQKMAAARIARAAEEKRRDELKAEAGRYEAECKDRLESLIRRRDETAAHVPAPALKLFDRVASKNDGKALAMVVRTNPRREEFACECCNMSITLQQVNALLSRDEPVLCHTCGHILYLETQSTPV